MKLLINLSGISFGDKALLEHIETSIGENTRARGLDTARLGFEITETTAVLGLIQAERWIGRLKSEVIPLDAQPRNERHFSYISANPSELSPRSSPFTPWLNFFSNFCRQAGHADNP